MSAHGWATWQVPTLVGFGAGRSAELGPQAAALGSAPAVLIDARVAESAAGRDLLARLAAHRVPPVSVTAVSSVPTLEDVREATGDVTGAGADMVIGVGGGSTMDTAKLAALAATNHEWLDAERWSGDALIDLDGDRGAGLRPGLPTLIVPTTTATGSELNSVAALVFEGRRRLMVTGRLAPTSAIVDPELSATLPVGAVLEGGVETLARIVCPYLVGGAALAVTDALAETLAGQCVTVLDRLARDSGDAEARAELAWVVAVSATQLVGMGRGRHDHVLWYLQDPLCTMLGVSKGRAMAALLPAYLDAIERETAIGSRFGSSQRLGRLGRALEGVLGKADFAAALAARLADWGLPLGIAELGPVDADALALACDEGRRDGGRLAGVDRSELAAFFAGAEGNRPIADDARPVSPTPDVEIT